MHIKLINVRLWNCSSHMFIILQCHCDKVKSSNSCVWDSGFACRHLDDQIVVLIVAHLRLTTLWEFLSLEFSVAWSW